MHVFSEKNTTFSQYNNLKQHEVTHFREKPSKFFSCENSFFPVRKPERTHIKDILRTHTGEMPYACLQFQKHFLHLCNLKHYKLTKGNLR